MRDLLYVAPGKPAPTGAIGLLVPELANPIFPALAQAMEARATANGLASILCNTGGNAAMEGEYVHMLLERRVDGMLVGTPFRAEIAEVRGPTEHHVAADGDVRGNERYLGHERDAARKVLARKRARVLLQHAHASFEVDESRDCTQSRGLAGAVGADPRDPFARLDGPGEAINDTVPAERHRHAVE